MAESTLPKGTQSPTITNCRVGKIQSILTSLKSVRTKSLRNPYVSGVQIPSECFQQDLSTVITLSPYVGTVGDASAGTAAISGIN